MMDESYSESAVQILSPCATDNIEFDDRHDNDLFGKMGSSDRGRTRLKAVNHSSERE
jgi:hypothetical protein